MGVLGTPGRGNSYFHITVPVSLHSHPHVPVCIQMSVYVLVCKRMCVCVSVYLCVYTSPLCVLHIL